MRYLFLCLTVAWGFAETLSAAKPKQPNIVIIMADDMGFSDIGCYGSEIKTRLDLATITPDIREPHVISHDDHDIRLFWLGC